jgi:ribosomal protein S12 methylthiotransferase
LVTRNSSACVVFLGCPKNQVDAEHVLGSLTEAGYSLTTDPRSADLIVITTCAFLQSAVRESEAAIEEGLRLKRGSPSKEVVVAGCLVERYSKSLKRKFPAVDLWVPIADMPRLAQLLALNRKPQAKRGVALSKRSASKGLSAETPRLRSGRQQRSSAICNESPRVLSTPSHFAYLKIADGCDNRCSYCMIPDIRGPFRSRPMRDIVAEASGLARAGVKELILVAQDTTQYGTDIYAKPSLSRLLQKLACVDGLRWLRLMYTHPAHLTEDVIDQFVTNPKLCRYIDLPIQHIVDHLLDKMNRHYTWKDVELLLHDLHAISDMHIRTTIIVGLPGETRRDFDELLAFIRQAKFDRLSCYAYSPEPGTKAARMPGQVSPAVKRERVRRLMLAQAAISRTNLKELTGRELTVLVDSPGVARTQWDAPEIDGVVKLSGRGFRPGRFVQAQVTSSSTHDLSARVL